MPFIYAAIALEFAFFGWCFWVLNPKHPERLEKLQKEWAPRG